MIKLICIDPVTDILNFGNGKPELTYGKEYEVDRWFEKHEDGRQFIGIINDSGDKSEYLITRLQQEQFGEICKLEQYLVNKLFKFNVSPD